MVNTIVKTECGCAATDTCDILEFMAKEVGATILHPGGMAATRKLVKALGLTQAGNTRKLLDVACGKGSSSLYFAKKLGISVTGIDLDPGLLCYADALRMRKSNKLDLSFVQGNAEKLPFPDNTFDVVIFQAALVLIENMKRALAEAARVLKPGGKIGLLEITWLKPPTESILKEAREKVCSICIGRAQDKKGWENLIAGVGLKLTHSSTHDTIKTNDEGFFRTVKMMWKMLTKENVRTRMNALGAFFKHSRGYFGYGVYVGKK